MKVLPIELSNQIYERFENTLMLDFLLRTCEEGDRDFFNTWKTIEKDALKTLICKAYLQGVEQDSIKSNILLLQGTPSVDPYYVILFCTPSKEGEEVKSFNIDAVEKWDYCISPLEPEDVATLSVDLRFNLGKPEELSRVLRENLINLQSLVAQAEIRGKEYLKNAKENTEVSLSIHAMERWVQRVWGVPAKEVSGTIKGQEKQVENEILGCYSTAEVVWEGDTELYKFGADNIMFVVSKASNKIITLYEEDFGFAKEINRAITFLQLQELRKQYDALKVQRKDYESSIDVASRKIEVINEEIADLERRVQMKKDLKAVLLSTKKNLEDTMLESESRYNKEHSKLFGKWANNVGGR